MSDILKEIIRLDKKSYSFSLVGDLLKCKSPKGKLKEQDRRFIVENATKIMNSISNGKKLLEKYRIHFTDNLEEIAEYQQENNFNRIIIDTETEGLDFFNDLIVMIQILIGDQIFLYRVGVRGVQGVRFDPLQGLLEDNAIVKVFQNAKFDVCMLKQIMPELEIKNIFDTKLAESVIDPTKKRCSLQELSWQYLNIWMPKEIGKSFKLGSELTEEQIEYAALDVAVLKEIMGFQVERLQQLELVKTARLEFAIIPALVDIERKGMLIGWNKLGELNSVVEAEAQELQKELVEMAKHDINWNSPKQTVEVLNKLGFKTKSSSKKALKKFEDPLIDKLLQYRKASKGMSAFLNKWPTHVNDATGRVHSNFNQLGTKTGRFSCSKPNLQQVPKKQLWRDLFVAPPGYKIITVDYGQIELRIIAEFTQDETFLKILQDGGDLHTTTAAAIFEIPFEKVNREQRDIAKSINFGLSYGMGPRLLSENVGISLAEAKAFISNHEKAYPRVKHGLDQLGFKALRNGYSRTPLGRKRFFGSGDSPQHLGRNSVVQATCGDILKRAILYLHQDLKDLDAHIINLVHDEVLIEANEDIVDQVVEIVQNDMKTAGADFLKAVPIEIDIHIGDTWRK